MRYPLAALFSLFTASTVLAHVVPRVESPVGRVDARLAEQIVSAKSPVLSNFLKGAGGTPFNLAVPIAAALEKQGITSKDLADAKPEKRESLYKAALPVAKELVAQAARELLYDEVLIGEELPLSGRHIAFMGMADLSVYLAAEPSLKKGVISTYKELDDRWNLNQKHKADSLAMALINGIDIAAPVVSASGRQSYLRTDQRKLVDEIRALGVLMKAGPIERDLAVKRILILAKKNAAAGFSSEAPQKAAVHAIITAAESERGNPKKALEYLKNVFAIASDSDYSNVKVFAVHNLMDNLAGQDLALDEINLVKFIARRAGRPEVYNEALSTLKREANVARDNAVKDAAIAAINEIQRDVASLPLSQIAPAPPKGARNADLKGTLNLTTALMTLGTMAGTVLSWTKSLPPIMVGALMVAAGVLLVGALLLYLLSSGLKVPWYRRDDTI